MKIENGKIKLSKEDFERYKGKKGFYVNENSGDEEITVTIGETCVGLIWDGVWIGDEKIIVDTEEKAVKLFTLAVKLFTLMETMASVIREFDL